MANQIFISKTSNTNNKSEWHSECSLESQGTEGGCAVLKELKRWKKRGGKGGSCAPTETNDTSIKNRVITQGIFFLFSGCQGVRKRK